MAIDFLSVDTTKRLGSGLIRAADLMRELRELIAKLTAAADHCNDGSIFTTLEAQFGLQAGKGANVASLLVGIRDILNTSTEFTGAVRLAKLEEFVGRLAGQ